VDRGRVGQASALTSALALRPGLQEEGEEGDAGADPCLECGRTYPHQHVRAVYGSQAAGGSSSDED